MLDLYSKYNYIDDIIFGCNMMLRRSSLSDRLGSSIYRQIKGIGISICNIGLN